MSALYTSDLDALQQAIHQHLAGCRALQGIAIIPVEVASIEQAVEDQLSQIGATIFVSEVELGGVSGDLANVSADEAQFTVMIFVSPTTNTTGRNAATLREYVMRRLHQYSPGVNGAGVITLVPDPEGSARKKDGPDIREITFRLSMTLEAGID